jgi:hypothetical protein
MGMNTLPIEELRSLLVAVSEHGKQHLSEVEADLQQTAFLLSEAIEKLGKSFMSVYELATEQENIVADLAKKYVFAETEKAKLNEITQQIGAEVNAAVTGLQFQDLTSQLIQRKLKRVGGLREILEELSAHGHGMTTDQEHSEIVRHLEQMNSSFNQGSHALSGGLMRRSVGQKDMSSGDVDLF